VKNEKSSLALLGWFEGCLLFFNLVLLVLRVCQKASAVIVGAVGEMLCVLLRRLLRLQRMLRLLGVGGTQGLLQMMTMSMLVSWLRCAGHFCPLLYVSQLMLWVQRYPA
jgi:hypothetical protein